jgi:tRNA C32,U32 (ribose-2'-O)-methylase TrmJ
MFSRAAPEKEEVNILRGLFAALEKAAAHPNGTGRAESASDPEK